MNFAGFAKAALQIGLDSFLIRPTRGIYSIQAADGSTLPDIIAQAVIEEEHTDEIEITDHPVQQGAVISDHTFRRPAEVKLHLGWSNSPSGPSSLVNAAIGAAVSNSPAARNVAGAVELVRGVQGIQSALNSSNIDQIQAIYKKLLALQTSRATFYLYTGKRIYPNMVCKLLTTATDAAKANNLLVTMVCREVIIVSSQTLQLPKEKQKQPQQTSSAVNAGLQNLTLSNDKLFW